MAPRKQATSRKTAVKRTTKKAAASGEALPKSMPKAGKDPAGGLTAAGRAFFAKKEGSHLRPGVKGAADTPEKMVRKGSFLRRHFAHPRGPMVDEKGKPTRLALSAQAWGEPLPKTMSDAKKLADKGHQLLEKYHQVQDKQLAKNAGEKVGKKTSRRAAKKAAKKAAPRAARKGTNS